MVSMEGDDKLVGALKLGDQQAFQTLVNLFSSKVFNLCFNFLKSTEEAEDATQEVFTIVFLSIKKFKGESKLSTWIYRISVNKCKEIIRNKSRKKRFGFSFPLEKAEGKQGATTFYHPGIELEDKERAAILYKAIDQLPDKQKTAFTLHKLEGVSYEEIAGIMETSLSSVESLIFRARQKLKSSLANYFSETED